MRHKDRMTRTDGGRRYRTPHLTDCGREIITMARPPLQVVRIPLIQLFLSFVPSHENLPTWPPLNNNNNGRQQNTPTLGTEEAAELKKFGGGAVYAKSTIELEFSSGHKE